MAGNAVDGVHNVFHSVPFERSHAVLGGAEGEEEWWEVEIGETEGNCFPNAGVMVMNLLCT